MFVFFSTANKRPLSELDLLQHGEYFRVMRPLFKHSFGITITITLNVRSIFMISWFSLDQEDDG